MTNTKVKTKIFFNSVNTNHTLQILKLLSKKWCYVVKKYK